MDTLIPRLTFNETYQTGHRFHLGTSHDQTQHSVERTRGHEHTGDEISLDIIAGASSSFWQLSRCLERVAVCLSDKGMW